MPRTARPAAVETLEDRRLMSTVVALGGVNTLLFFDTRAPGTTLGKLKVRGLARREELVAIDVRPADGKLYALGDTSRLYSVDLVTGRATESGGQAFEPLLTGASFGFDFDPAADQARVTSSNTSNFRLDPVTGMVLDADPATAATQTDDALAYLFGDPGADRVPNVTGIAYATAPATDVPAATLYGIDVDANALVLVGSAGGAPDAPNTGRLSTVGPLGVDPTGPVGFDIAAPGPGAADVAYASMPTSSRGRSGLYSINLTTGSATSLGIIRGTGGPVTDIAVLPYAPTVVAVDAKNRLFTFTAGLPTLTTSEHKISGLARREQVLDVDVRPADGTPYALTTQGRLYRLDAASGAAVAIGTAAADVPINRRAAAVIDFDPDSGALRVVNAAGQNYRIDPTTGAIVDGDTATPGVQLDAPLAYADGDSGGTRRPDLRGIAYSYTQATGTDGIGGALVFGTVLYGIDGTSDTLVSLGSSRAASAGQASTVGPLTVDARDLVGFDVPAPPAGATTASLSPPYATFRERRGGYGLYAIDLATGAATRLGNLARGVVPVGITVLPTG